MDLISDFVRIGASAALYVLGIFGWGNSAFRLLGPDSDEQFWDYILSRIVGGCAVLYLLFIGLSAAGFLFPVPVGIVLILGIAGGFAGLQTLFRKIQSQLEEFRQWSSVERLLGRAAFLLVALQLACGLTPLIFYDLQVYHLVGPSQFLRTGALVEIPWNVLTNSPMALQLTLGMSLVMDSEGAVAKLLLAVFGCLLAVAFTQLIADRKVSLLVAVFVLCYPEFWLHQVFGVIDLSAAAFLILGMAWTRRSVQGGSRRWVVLAGCAFGFAIASRYQAIVLTVWGLVALLIERVRAMRSIERSTPLRFATIGAVASLFVAPWLIRNMFHFGNPVYPLLAGVFGGAGWSSAQAERMNSVVFGPPLTALPLVGWLTAPVSALVAMPSNGLFGLSLILGAALALFLSRNAEIRMTAVLGIGGLILWSIFQPTGNFNLIRFNAASIALVLAATAGILADDALPHSRGVYAGMTLAGGSLLIALPFVQSVVPAWQTLVSATGRAAVWRANVPSWQAYAAINEELDPHRHKVLLIGETRSFWLQVPFLAPTAFDGPRLSEIFSGSDETAWRKRMEDLGITHVLISHPEWDRIRDSNDYLRLPPDDMSRLNAWLKTLPVLFDDTRGTLVLTIDSGTDR